MTALVLAMFLAAIEATIVATAMPSIAAELGGFALYGWVFSSYLLMQAITTPIFGKLADVYGRKPVFVAGVAIFLVGSVMCALAGNMPLLVAFRLVQGIGAGAVLPIAVTLAGDLYSLEERGRVQGYIASVWGVSSILGPLAGGLIVEHLGWPWIFWINLPFGLLSMLLLSWFLHEKVERRTRKLDLAGAGLLLASLATLMLALSLRGSWAAPLLGLCLVATGLFLRQETRAADPVVHLELWKQPLVLRGNLTVLMIGVAMLGLIGFLPTYVQGVLGRSPLVAGFALSAMCIGWPIASVTAGRLLLHVPLRVLARTGGVTGVAGALLIALTVSWGPIWAGVGSFIVGVGFGILNTSFLVAIQTSVPWEKRGMATAGNMLMRNLGNALGATVLGALLNSQLAGYLERQGLTGQVSLEHVRELVGEGAPALDPATMQLLQGGLDQALQLVFWGVFAAVLFGAVFAWGVPNLRLSDTKEDTGSDLQ